jgi:hypothetical protein
LSHTYGICTSDLDPAASGDLDARFAIGFGDERFVFRTACARVGITRSMGRVGSALDNAVIEVWHSIVEFEPGMLEHFQTLAQARARTAARISVAAWIEESGVASGQP